MTKYRFRRMADGTIVVRAERKIGKQLLTSITKVLGPTEDVSSAMKELYAEVQLAGRLGPLVHGTANKPGVGA